MSEAADRRIEELEREVAQQSLLVYSFLAASGGELFVGNDVVADGLPDDAAIEMEPADGGFRFKLVSLDSI